jgi:cell division protein FtsB
VSTRTGPILRWLALALLLVIVLLQLRLWTGQYSMREAWRLDERVLKQREENERLQERNAALAADVEDLKTGQEAVEERARSELGMTKPGETFYQVIEPATPEAAAAAEAGTAPTPQ